MWGISKWNTFQKVFFPSESKLEIFWKHEISKVNSLELSKLCQTKIFNNIVQNFRSNFEVLKQSFDKNNSLFYAINGNYQTQNLSVEVYQNSKWLPANFTLPSNISLFCVAWKDENTILIYSGELFNSRENFNLYTYFLDIRTKLWRKGPKTSNKGADQKCGRITTSRYPIQE